MLDSTYLVNLLTFLILQCFLFMLFGGQTCISHSYGFVRNLILLDVLP